MKIQKNVNLAKLTTFRVGGVGDFYVEVDTEDDLKKAVNLAKTQELPIFVLGGGSNIVVSDSGFRGLVIKPVNMKIEIKESERDVILKVGAGLWWDELVVETVKRNLQGIECLSGIPGTVGGAIVQNIGAYGQEIKDLVVSVRAFDVERGVFKNFTNEECKFDYRESFFKNQENMGKFIVVSVWLKLRKNSDPLISYEALKNYMESNKIQPTLKSVRESVLKLREENHILPEVAGNAGSFFKNPVVTKEKLEELQQKYPDIKYFPFKSNFKISAGWLIERAGWKGKSQGNVAVSPKHALVIINPDMKAKAFEILRLAEKISEDVSSLFGISLEREVRYIGDL